MGQELPQDRWLIERNDIHDHPTLEVRRDRRRYVLNVNSTFGPPGRHGKRVSSPTYPTAGIATWILVPRDPVRILRSPPSRRTRALMARMPTPVRNNSDSPCCTLQPMPLPLCRIIKCSRLEIHRKSTKTFDAAAW